MGDLSGTLAGALRSNAARWLLGALLALMATGQLADPAGFVDILATYRFGGRAVAVPVAIVLIGGELTAAIGLLAGSGTWRRRSSSVAVVVAVAWTVLGVQAFVRGLALDNCGCFGVYAGQSLRWWVLIEDAEFVAGAVWVHHGIRRAAGSGKVATEAFVAADGDRMGSEV
jgi:hypothetical protein